MTDMAKQVGRFSVVGALAFAVDYVVLMLLTFRLGMRTADAAAISFLVVNLFTYYMDMHFVFSHREDISRTREFLTFAALLFVGMLINEAVISLIVGVAGKTELTVSVAKVASSMAVTTWNFFSRRRWLDAGSQKVPQASE